MENNKLKTYVIMLSKSFMKGHPKAGKPTGFANKFTFGEKIHTIRENYPLWEKRIKEVQEGKAVLSIRQWYDKPYRSRQVVIKDLTADDGVGIQPLMFSNNIHIGLNSHPLSFLTEISKNDGLEINDFTEWFKYYDLSTDFAIIHFTPFRYGIK